MTTKVADDRQGIQSIEVGFRLLDILSATARPMMLRDIARGAGMPAAKAHRYMVSFMRVGLIEQDSATGRYDLGPYALQLGIAGLARLDPVRLAAPYLESLCEEIGETVALAVWGNCGPTIVRVVDAGGPVTITLRTGTVLSLTRSATGRAFAAFSRMPHVRSAVLDTLRAEAEESRLQQTQLRRQLEKTLGEFRQHGLARATGNLTPGINGFSAPVYDHSGGMVAALTSLGSVGEFSADWDSPVAVALSRTATELSARLGYNSDNPLLQAND